MYCSIVFAGQDKKEEYKWNILISEQKMADGPDR